ncbi:MAG: hypothetical protein FWD54_01625 [Endomicrobia bacterium]|nr:hypothetical protein [Endomicrobiia bacterium]
MKKIGFFIFALALISLSSCASAPKNNVSENVKEDVAKSVPNYSNVTFYFESGGKSVLTFWRKINDDGSKGKRFSIGGASKAALFMNGGFRDPFPQTVKLKPGTYYLDSFQTASGIVSQKKHYLLRNGWDDKENKPLFLSFTITDNQSIVLPKVEIIPLKQSDNTYRVEFKIDENKDIFTLGTLAVKTDVNDSQE